MWFWFPIALFAVSLPIANAMNANVWCVLRVMPQDPLVAELYALTQSGVFGTNWGSNTLAERYADWRFEDQALSSMGPVASEAINPDRAAVLARRSEARADIVRGFRAELGAVPLLLEKAHAAFAAQTGASSFDDYIFHLFEENYWNYWRSVREGRRSRRSADPMQRLPAELAASVRRLRENPTVERHRQLARETARLLESQGARTRVVRILRGGRIQRYQVRVLPPTPAEMRGHGVPLVSRLAYSFSLLGSRVVFDTGELVADMYSDSLAFLEASTEQRLQFDSDDNPLATIRLPWRDVLSRSLSIDARHELGHYFHTLFRRQERLELTAFVARLDPRMGQRFEFALPGQGMGMHQVTSVDRDADRWTFVDRARGTTATLTYDAWVALDPQWRGAPARPFVGPSLRSARMTPPLPFLFIENLAVPRTGALEGYSANEAREYDGTESSMYSLESRGNLQTALRLREERDQWERLDALESRRATVELAFYALKTVHAAIDAQDFLRVEIPLFRAAIQQLRSASPPTIDLAGQRIPVRWNNADVRIRYDGAQLYRRLQLGGQVPMDRMVHLTSEHYAWFIEQVLAFKEEEFNRLREVAAQIPGLLAGIPMTVRHVRSTRADLATLTVLLDHPANELELVE